MSIYDQQVSLLSDINKTLSILDRVKSLSTKLSDDTSLGECTAILSQFLDLCEEANHYLRSSQQNCELIRKTLGVNGLGGTETAQTKIANSVGKFVAAVDIASKVVTMIGSPPPPNPTPSSQKQDSAYVQYQGPNSCSLKDKIDPKKSSVVEEYESIPKIFRGADLDDHLEKIGENIEEEIKRREKEADASTANKNQGVADGSPPPDQA